MFDWNYRIAKFATTQETFYSIVEAFYNQDGDVIAITGEPFFPSATTPEELGLDLNHMLEALEKPVLDASDVGMVSQTHEAVQ